MAREKTNLRQRPHSTGTSASTNAQLEGAEEKLKEKMPSWCSKIFYPYRLLLLFSLVVCLLQILIGVSFFSTFSSQQGSRKAPEPPDVPPRPPAVPAPDALAAKQAASLASRHPELHVPCNVTGKEAVSAVTRATSRQCKQELVDLVCALEQGGVYPTSLPRFCPSQVDAKLRGEHIGCYQDTFAKRLLQGHTVKLKETNGPAACVEVCSKYGFSFAGVQYGVECFCGNSQPEAARELEDERCDMGCPGEEGETCGGYLTMEVLETGVRPLVPSKLGQAEAAAGPPVRIVYLLTVSGRAIRQVRRLIKRIYSPDHYILVHVDARQEFMHREVSKLAAVLPNLRMVQSRFSTIWGGASLLSMLLSALQELLAMEDWTDWDFVLNLSESDFPVKTQAELVTFLSANRGSNFVKSHGREQDKFIKKQGLDKTFHECDTHMWRLGGRSLPLGVQIDGGSDWICLNRDFARYVVRSEDELVTGLKTLFSYTLLPAESFFHTVLRNSAYCTTYIDNNLHLTNWKRKQGCKCQYKAIVDWCGCSPNDFLAEDWLKLEGTKARQLFFARKFEAIVHQGVVNRVEAWVEGEAAVEAVSRDSYWQNVFHHEDIKPSMDSNVITGLVNHVLSGVSGECRLEQAKVLEVTSYALNSRFDSNLVHLEATDLNQPGSARLQLEVKMKHQPKHRQGLTQHGTRYQSMTVGTDFDPKELLFRCFVKHVFCFAPHLMVDIPGISSVSSTRTASLPSGAQRTVARQPASCND
jgi:protein xylosyltransferase